jgi:ABC-type nitrate/sulfonate/bicarbonate transport system permease component
MAERRSSELAGLMAARAQMKWLRRGFERNLSVVAVLVLWEITTRAGVFNNFLLPPLSKVLMRGWLDLLNGEIPRKCWRPEPSLWSDSRSPPYPASPPGR